MSDSEKKGNNFILLLSKAIIRYRYIIFLLFIIFGIYCGINFGRGGNNADLTAFLSPATETRRGLAIMEEEFIEYSTADVMISNITYERAEVLSGQIAAWPHVSSVEFDRSRSHYANAAALFQVTFDAVQDDPVTEAALETLREKLSGYDLYIHTQIGYDFAGQIAHEMGGVLGIAAVVIAVILLFTSRSYFEVVIFFIVFFFAALFNMGTNFWLGEMVEAVNQSFPTILTSGSILTLAGLIISWCVTDVYVGHIGLAVGRGALTSSILVMTVLPQLLVLCDRLIFKTRFRIDLTGGEDT